MDVRSLDDLFSEAYQVDPFPVGVLDMLRRGAAHDHFPSGHPGRTETHTILSRNYFWNGMTKFISRYVKNCMALSTLQVLSRPLPGFIGASTCSNEALESHISRLYRQASTVRKLRLKHGHRRPPNEDASLPCTENIITEDAA
ncbi:hypothetical protein TSTA_103350 [Talaromyces stipitatus ATCC 10500]|uniref:Integrase zinc-binding domain-containing protein n=1 Tax=Talaromyces stipitatus (strain ATCC 10500 / CBS 375.48 / QM 6759 / NRRL 1006) TaxID=441959 RepID=B8MNM2_TALSN|nr:uncharacterized protein TSTA_103350 [Talaromyces stipitatus ATCC 10500]EED14111.1 hypothetical protein TSTA_103350 [Talaromyces stipitatus ATCC 10500]